MDIEFQAKESRTDTPDTGIVQVRTSSDSWQDVGNWEPGTTDTTWSWYTTSVSSYMNSSGVVGFLFCACPTSGNTNSYDISADMMRFKLTLN